MLNLKEDTFFFQKFNLQILRDGLQILIASISDRGSIKKIWIQLDALSLSCSIELFMNENILPFLKSDNTFSGHPNLKDNCDDMNNCLKQPDLPYIYQPMLIFQTKSFFCCSGSWDQYFPSFFVDFCGSKLLFLFTYILRPSYFIPRICSHLWCQMIVIFFMLFFDFRKYVLFFIYIFYASQRVNSFPS